MSFWKKLFGAKQQGRVMEARPLIFLLVGMIAAICAANAQQPEDSKDTSSKARTFLAGQIQIGHKLASMFYAVDNDVFICTPIEGPRTEGVLLAAIGSEDQIWSMTTMPLSNGMKMVQYPVLADVRTPSGERRALLPAVLKVKIDIKAGEVLRSSGPVVFEIKTKRSIKAGESISSLFVNGKDNTPSILSVEAADDQPSFTAFLRDDKPDGRRAAIEAWQIERDYVNN